MPSRLSQSRSWCVSGPVLIACLVAASVAAQTAREARGAGAVDPLQKRTTGEDHINGLAPRAAQILIKLVNCQPSTN